MAFIKDQVIEDPVTGLVFQFRTHPDGSSSMDVFGNFEFGNRNFGFRSDGTEMGRGTYVGENPVNRPTFDAPLLKVADWLPPDHPER